MFSCGCGLSVASLCSQALESFSWNIRVLKGQAELLLTARQECQEYLRQVISIPPDSDIPWCYGDSSTWNPLLRPLCWIRDLTKSRLRLLQQQPLKSYFLLFLSSCFTCHSIVCNRFLCEGCEWEAQETPGRRQNDELCFNVFAVNKTRKKWVLVVKSKGV